MQIAIIGAGFAGVALCSHLLQHKKKHAIEVTLFDPAGIGGGPSGASSGLLHTYMGAEARRIKMADQYTQAALQLIHTAQDFTEQPVILSNGILRPAASEKQLLDFKKASENYPEEVKWWDSSFCTNKVSGLQCRGGIFISSGLTLDSKNYLNGLWNSCKQRGALLQTAKINSLKELDKFDAVVAATGFGTKKIPELAALPLNPVKGQMIELKWPSALAKLPFSLISHCYIVMQPEGNSCMVGATYEKEFSSPLPEPEVASGLLRKKAEELLPELNGAELISCRAGVRIFSPDRLTPILGKMPAQSQPTWIFTALGSKGLIYHGWMAELLSRAIIENNPQLIPKELSFRLC